MKKGEGGRRKVEMRSAAGAALAAVCAWFLGIWGPAVGLGAEARGVPVDGEPFAGELAAVDAAWQITFSAGEKPKTLPAADLVAWGRCRELTDGPVVVLGDGNLVVADVLAADRQQLTVDSLLFGTVKLPLETVAGVVFQLPVERGARDRLLDRVASAEGRTDQVLLANGDAIRGRVDAIRDRVVRVQTDVGAVDMKFDRISALILDPSLVQHPARTGLGAWAGFADGSRLVARQLVVEQGTLRMTSPAGTVWNALPEDLVFLQPLGGRAVYLSDRKPAGYRHVPYLDLAWPFQMDRNVLGGMLCAGDRLHLKGLGMHSASRLSFALGPADRRFQAELAIDDSAEGRGSVRFRVFVDGREKFASPTVRSGAEPLPVSVDVTGGKRLDLIVEYAERADELDHADWLDARLVYDSR